MALCVTIFFCYAQNYVTLPLIPLMVISVGGDAAMVGVVIAVFSGGSFVLRPFVGQVVDRWSLRGVLAVGAVILSATGFAYAVPSLAALLVNRLVHGAGWAAVNTAGAAAVAMLAPPGRRGEAGAYYNMMPGLAQAAMPAVALALLPGSGFGGAFVLAGVCGLAALVFVVAIDVPSAVAVAPPATGFWRGLLDRSAFAPMAMQALSASAMTLFIAFVPLYAAEIGVAVGSLGPYFVVVGITQVLGLALLGRLSDRIGRGPVIVLGGLSTAVGVVLLATATTLAGLVAAAFCYAVGFALVSPTTFALAADRADPARRGVAFATYSMSFQLANGVAGLLWGALITVSGFGAVFAVAATLQLAVVAAGARVAGPSGRRRLA